MKFLLCALFASLYVAAMADPIMEREGYYFDNRIRTGHMNEFPFADLYKNYVQVFIAPAHAGTTEHQSDSYKNYAASAEVCFEFFKSFIANNYELEKIEKLVQLDACLGYLYDDEYVNRYHAIDKQRPLVAAKLDGYINDQKLKDIYQGTIIKTMDRQPQLCIANLLLRTIQIKQQFPDLACNNHHIELLNIFGDCHKDIPANLRTEDTYISTLYKLVKSKGEECFEAEILATNEAIRKKYKNNWWQRTKKWSPLNRQIGARMWPQQVADLLIAVEGINPKKDVINLREILAFARATWEHNERPEDRNYVVNLLTNLSRYATKHIKLDKVPKKWAVQDEDGRVRYQQLINHLCEFFRSTDNEDYYDYATSFTRLVRMLNFPELFDLDKKKFTDDILNGYEIAPTYISVMMCNIISHTEGFIVNEEKKDTGKKTNKKVYRVVFNQNTKDMIRWPDVGYY